MDTDGTINGRDPLDAITLSDAQDWPGSVTFSQLEVTEELQVDLLSFLCFCATIYMCLALQLNGSAQGRHFDQAPLNPTLLESQHIHAACHFGQLIVNGPLLLRGLLDNQSYDSLFDDLALRPSNANDELLIAGAKHVQHFTLPVDAHVVDGLLTGIPIDRFVNKHGNQTLHNVSQLNGYIYFHRLGLSGTYDNVKLDHLLEQTLRVDAPLVGPTTHLRFVNDLQLPQLHVTRMLNDVPLATGYQTLGEPMHLSEAHFQQLQAEQVDVTHNVTGGGQLNGHSLHELLQYKPRLDHVQVQELILPMGVEASRLQGFDANRLLSFLGQLDELPLLILHGQLQVEQIAVSGGVQVMGTLNGRDLAQLQRDVVWLDQPNELRTRWRMQDSPVFTSDLVLQGSYNHRLFPELLNDIVFRSDQQHELIIRGTKNFVGDVRVRNELQLHSLNGIPFEKLANRLQPLNFAGNVHLQGNLYVSQLQLLGELNGRAVSQLEQRLQYHPQLYAFVHRGQIRLPQMQLQDLTVLGHLGNRSLEPLQQFFNDVIDKQQTQVHVESHKIFTGRVSIQGGAHIRELNGIHLEELLKQLIFIDGNGNGDYNEVTLHTPVRFEAPVTMNGLHVEHLWLQGERLNGINISEWIHDTIRVDQNWQAERKRNDYIPLQITSTNSLSLSLQAVDSINFASGALDNNVLHVEQLNHLNLSRVVTLHTAQNLTFPLVAKELHLDDAGHVELLEGLVNGRNLSEEYANTLLVSAG